MTLNQTVGTEPIEIAVAVVEREGEVLIGLRGQGAPLAGLWEFPGGKIAAGETLEDAARRECWEETGLSIRITGNYPSVVHDYPQGSVRLHFFSAEAINGARLPERFRWVRRAELGNYEFPPANAELLALLRRQS